ncbi:MAG: type II secretion system F family protein [Acidimicrobiales bacterium]
MVDFPTVEAIVSLPAAAAEGLDPSAFTVTEDGTVVTPSVTSLAAGDLDVVLAIDTSGSMAGAAIESARRAAAAFVGELPVNTRFAVVGFGPEPLVASSLTQDRAVVAAALDGLRAGGETALHDGVIAAADQVGGNAEARTALVVLSDGADTVSAAALDDAAALASARFDVVHAVSLTTGEQDVAALARLVSGGGAVVEAEDPVALAAVYSDVASRIVNQYTLRWDSTVEDDASVVIRFDQGDLALVATRLLDLDDDLVASLAAPPATITAPPPPVVTEPIVSAPVPVDPADPVPSWFLWVGVGSVAVALFVAGVVASAPRQRQRNLAAELRQRIPDGHELTGIGRRIVGGVERFLRRDPDREMGLALRLDRAGTSISPGEFGSIVVIGTAILALLGLGLFGVLGLLIGGAIGVLGPLGWVDSRGTRRSKLFTEQLDATLQLIAGSLRSGFGVMQAVNTVAVETEWPTNEEFTRVLGEVRLGRGFVEAMEASARRIDTPDYTWTVQAMAISNEVGGNLAEVLGNVSQTIRQRNTLRRQVASLSAEGRVSAVILLALPVGMFAWMSFSNPDYVGLLTGRPGGRIALVAGLALIVTGGLWMRKIVKIQF